MVRMRYLQAHMPVLSLIGVTMRRMTGFLRRHPAALVVVPLLAVAGVAAIDAHFVRPAPMQRVEAATAAEARDRAVIAETRIRDAETCAGIQSAAVWIDAAGHADPSTPDGLRQFGRRYEAALQRLGESRPYTPPLARAHELLRAAVVAVAYDPTAAHGRETATSAAALAATVCADYAAGRGIR